ncbi:hypothetical protein BD410DRAFT_790072 [Rickenella mellea]|uniref:Uncharacterized protein n=1 Tax=Rickenella mellea TaxID=50990 RepID=A0A4Y7Q1J9_9AGAM|nr:hypothetical protein BD410DRAFT_790072 [Rickenella mellea]
MRIGAAPPPSRVSLDTFASDGTERRNLHRVGIHRLANLQQPSNLSTNSLCTFSSSSSTSTIPGVGMVSGRIIKRFGEAIIHYVEEPIIWRRLRMIRRQFDDEELRRAIFEDPKVFYGVLTDLFELQKNAHSRGHSIRGYPKRINQASTLLLQRIEDQAWPTIGESWFTDEVANSVLMCYCEIYWSQQKPDTLLQFIKQIFKLLDSRPTADPDQTLLSSLETPSQMERTFHERGVPILCDFAASCAQCLLHSGSWLTTARVYNTLRQLSPSIITSDAHFLTLELGFNSLMTRLQQPNLILMYDANILYNATVAFEPLIATNADYEIHLTSLLCACNHRRASKLKKYFQLSNNDRELLDSVVYPLKLYERSELPPTEVVVPINVEFTLALFRAVLQISQNTFTSIHQDSERYERVLLKCTLESITRLARTTRTRSCLLRLLNINSPECLRAESQLEHSDIESQYADIKPAIMSVIEGLDNVQRRDSQISELTHRLRVDRRSVGDVDIMEALYPLESEKVSVAMEAIVPVGLRIIHMGGRREVRVVDNDLRTMICVYE